MKHYAKFKGGDEYDLIRPKSRRYICHSAEWLAQTKNRYRRRERAQLKRMTAELVAEELDRWHNAEYWEHELDELFGELQGLEAEEERAWEFAEVYGWEYHDAAYYREAYRALFERIDEVYGELAMVA